MLKRNFFSIPSTLKLFIIVILMFAGITGCKYRADESDVSEIRRNKSVDRRLEGKDVDAIKKAGLRSAILVSGTYLQNLDRNSKSVHVQLSTVTAEGEVLAGVDKHLLVAGFRANMDRMVREGWRLKDIFRFPGNDDPQINEVIDYLVDSDTEVLDVKYHDYFVPAQFTPDKAPAHQQTEDEQRREREKREEKIIKDFDNEARLSGNIGSMEELAILLSKTQTPTGNFEKLKVNYAQLEVTTDARQRELIESIKRIEIKPLELNPLPIEKIK